MRFTKSSSGFTLLEVILAITILTTLTILSTQAISRALKARTKIQAEVDDVSALRDSMRMIRSDITQALHYLDIEKEILDRLTKTNTTQTQTPPTPGQTQTGQSAYQAPPRKTKRFDPVTQFIGTENELNFVTMNSIRTVTSISQADFTEVGYALKDCSNLTSRKSSQCLYRRTQNVIDEDVKAGGNEIVMLENVTEFKLRYIGPTKQDWVSSWNSSPNSSDVGTRNVFPEIVEVSLSIQREIEGKPRTYSMQFVIPIHFPNNPEKSSNSTNQSEGANKNDT